MLNISSEVNVRSLIRNAEGIPALLSLLEEVIDKHLDEEEQLIDELTRLLGKLVQEEYLTDLS